MHHHRLPDPSHDRRIAIVGGGVAGLSAAWLLSRRHQVTLYEKEDWIGGHAHTVDVETPDGPLAFQKALHRVRVHDGVNPHFLQLTLEALAVTGDLEEHFTGTTIKHLPQERLRALTIWVLDKVAQDSIVEEASSLRLALDRVLIATERASRQAENLRRSVLNAAFSGQLTRESISV